MVNFPCELSIFMCGTSRESNGVAVIYGACSAIWDIVVVMAATRCRFVLLALLFSEFLVFSFVFFFPFLLVLVLFSFFSLTCTPTLLIVAKYSSKFASDPLLILLAGD